MGRHGTIAGRKAAQDSKRAAMFTKYAKAITVAAKDGGDPEYNAGLRVAIEKAKAISMPNDNIQRAIKKGTGELEGVSYEELSFEGYGAGGVAVIVDCLTDNTNRTTSFVRSTFDKHGGNLGTNGCVSYMFSRKGVILIEKTDAIDEDSLMETALEAGADDILTDEDGSIEVTCEPAQFEAVSQAFEAAGLKPEFAEITYKPLNETKLEGEDAAKMQRLIDALEELDDVQQVYTTASFDEAE